jgi:hypothetical protein
MKTKLIVIMFLFLGIKTFSQLQVVSDPKNTAISKSNAVINKASLAKNAEILTKATASLEETKKSVKLLSDAKDAIEKVSTVIKDMNSLYIIIDMQNKMISKAKTDISKLKDSNLFSTREIVNVSSTFTTIIITSSKMVDLIKKLVEDNLFKMTDAERLTLIKEVEEDVKSAYLEILYFSKKYNTIMNRRIIKKLAKKNR